MKLIIADLEGRGEGVKEGKRYIKDCYNRQKDTWGSARARIHYCSQGQAPSNYFSTVTFQVFQRMSDENFLFLLFFQWRSSLRNSATGLMMRTG